VGVLLLTSLLLQAPALQQPACPLAAPDRAWVDTLLDTWRGVARDALRIDPEPLPLIIVFNESCVWRIGDTVDGAAHGGTIPLPDGGMVPARLMTFAGTYGSDDRPFLVMAMPSIWRADPKHQDDPGLPLLIRAVFAHEMTHTVQARGIGQWLAEVEKRLALPEGLDDDIIQTRYEKDPDFRAAVAAERSLLYQAVAEANASVRRALLSTAVSAIAARRQRYFSGDAAVYAELEDIFLNMEGLGNWAAYQVARREGLEPADARAFIRGGGERWSQDEGLAAFLLLDALLPDWRDRVLKGRPASVLALLTEASRR
jgi:hypothetical protein